MTTGNTPERSVCELYCGKNMKRVNGRNNSYIN